MDSRSKAGLSEYRDRLSRLEKFLETDPGNRHLLQEAAELALKCGEFAQAGAFIQAALHAQPGDPAIRFQQGTLALAERRWDDGAAVFESLWKDGQTHPAIRYNLAYAQSMAGRYAEAQTVLDTFGEPDWSAVPDAHKIYAHACHHLGKPEAGIAHLKARLLDRKDDAEAWGLLSMLQYDSEQSEEIEASAERALNLQADEPNALLALGSFWLERQDPEKALEFLQPLVARHPQLGRAWSGVAFARMLKMDLAGALDAFERATSHMPNHIGTWHGLAWLQILKNDLQGAKTSFDKAMAIDRNFGETHGGLAVVAVLEGRVDEAQPMIRRALGLNKASFAGHFASSLLLAGKGRREEAQEIIRRLMAVKPAGGSSIQELVAHTLKRRASRNDASH